MVKKFFSGLVMGSLLLNTVLPAAAATTIKIKNNGAKSENKVEVKQECKQEVKQENKTDVDLVIDVYGNSGGNSASGNTGGKNTIKTGNVTNSVLVDVAGGNNTAAVPDCCCGDESADISVAVKGNGYRSENEVELEVEKETEVEQEGETKLDAYIGVAGKTGYNKTKRNTRGKNKIKTGDVENLVGVVVTGGHNTLE